jgi:hypothetical protein
MSGTQPARPGEDSAPSGQGKVFSNQSGNRHVPIEDEQDSQELLPFHLSLLASPVSVGASTLP